MAKRGSYVKGISKRQEILTTALQVFASNGYSKTLFRDLADAANISQAGLLHYFGSKDELLVGVLRHRDEVNSAIPDQPGSSVDRFRQIIEANAAVPGLVQLFATMSVAAVNEEHPGHAFFADRYKSARESMAADIRARRERGEIAGGIDEDALAALLVAAADGLQVQWLLDPTIDMAKHIDQLWMLAQRRGADAADHG